MTGSRATRSGLGAYALVILSACADVRPTEPDAGLVSPRRDAGAVLFDAAAAADVGVGPPDVGTDVGTDAGVCVDRIDEIATLSTTGSFDEATGVRLVHHDGAGEVDVLRGLAPAHEGLAPTVDVVQRPNGVDLELVYTHTGDAPAAIGSFTVRALLEGEVRWQDTRFSTEEQRLAPGEESYEGHAIDYPGWAYAPVTVLSDSRYTLGAAFIHDWTTLEHVVRTRVRSPAPTEPAPLRPWLIDFFIDDTLEPGETRSYRVTLRLARATEHWLRTLVPYRNYFVERHGRVRYARDTRPMVRVEVANVASTAELYYTYSPERSPVLVGWGPWATEIDALRSIGYHRATLWGAAGLCDEPSLNYPFSFATPLAARPMAGSLAALRSLASGGFELGLWWGRATSVASGFCVGDTEPLDREDPEHRRLALAELDAAREAGAALIGLDAFGYQDRARVWIAYHWLPILQAHAPEARFVQEGPISDVTHTLAPGYFGLPSASLVSSHTVADFLVPGHETYLDVSFYALWSAEDPLWWMRPAEEKRAEVERVAALGFVPSVGDMETPIDDTVRAAPSWEHTVPPALRSPCP